MKIHHRLSRGKKGKMKCEKENKKTTMMTTLSGWIIFRVFVRKFPYSSLCTFSRSLEVDFFGRTAYIDNNNDI